MKYKVSGYDSNYGFFSEIFDNKDRALGFYMYHSENASYVNFDEVAEE